MKICPNCGQEAQEQDLFCTNCGEKLDKALNIATAPEEPVAPEATETAKTAEATKTVEAAKTVEVTEVAKEERAEESVKNTADFARYTVEEKTGKGGVPKAFIGIVAAVVLLLVGIFAFGKNLLFSGLGSSAEDRFLKYQSEYFNGKIKSMEELGFINQETKEMTMVLTGEVDGREEINKYLEDSSLTLKAKTDPDKGSMQMSMGMQLMGSDILDAYAEYMDGVVGFALPAIDEHFYKGDYKTVIKNLTGEEVEEAPNLKKTKENQKTLEKLLKKYGALYATLITKDNLKVEKQEVSLDGLGQKFKGEVYTFTPKAEEVKAFLEKLADTVEKDKDLEELLEQGNYGSQINDAMGLGSSLPAKEQLQEFAQKIREAAEDSGQEIEDANFTWIIAVEGKKLRQIKISSNQYVCSLEIAKDGDKTIEQLNLKGGEGETFYLKNEYALKGKTLNGSISGGNGIFNITGLEYAIETGKKSILMPYGTYTVKDPTGMGGQAILTVKDGEKNSSDHELVLSGLEAYSMGLSGVKLNLNTSDKADITLPKGEVVDVSNYSEDDFYELGEKFAQGFQRIYMNLLGVTE